jgi:prepilin-type processing-associated H-X9-DG protein
MTTESIDDPQAPRASMVPTLVLTAFVLIVVGFTLPAFDRKGPPPHSRCAGNLKHIGAALINYANSDANGRFPETEDFAVLDERSYLRSATVYACPDDVSPNQIAAKSNYVYVGAGFSHYDLDLDKKALAYCDRHGNWTNILYADGHVKGQPGHAAHLLRQSYERMKK